MKITSTDSNGHNSLDSNKINCCYAFDCNLDSSNKLDIDCGSYGKLTIFVCDKCVSKFNMEKKD
ncbi:MAG: hypothetical protein L0H55_15440 [Candidatus Nitrosocosmicus sp.]|nr:hypothetical protein [Candidatus Nitrosocosmicus sp.]